MCALHLHILRVSECMEGRSLLNRDLFLMVLTALKAYHHDMFTLKTNFQYFVSLYLFAEKYLELHNPFQQLMDWRLSSIASSFHRDVSFECNFLQGSLFSKLMSSLLS